MLIAISKMLGRLASSAPPGPTFLSVTHLFLFLLCHLEFSNPLLLCNLKRRLLMDPLSTFEGVLEILRCQNSPRGLFRLSGEGRAKGPKFSQ